MTRLDPTFVAAQFYTSYQTPRVWVNDATQYGMDVLKNAEVRTGSQDPLGDYHCICGHVRFHLPCSPLHPLLPCDTREPPQTRARSTLTLWSNSQDLFVPAGMGGRCWEAQQKCGLTPLPQKGTTSVGDPFLMAEGEMNPGHVSKSSSDMFE